MSQQGHALALLENGWTVRQMRDGRIQWRSPRGISGEEYRSTSLDDPPGDAIDEAIRHEDYYVQ